MVFVNGIKKNEPAPVKEVKQEQPRETEKKPKREK